MIKILSALLLTSTSALAADLPARPVAPPTAKVVTAPDWTGFYVGVSGGYGWSNVKSDVDAFSLDPRGWLIGGYAGYNWSYGAIVAGLEGSYSQANLKRVIEDVSLTTKLDRLADVRARVGYLLSPSILAYGTGGVAWGSANAQVIGASAHANQWGWVAGGGLETRLGNHIALGLEYLHYSLSDAAFTFTAGPPVNARSTADTVKLKLGYQF